MPEYLYIDGQGHEVTLVLPMTALGTALAAEVYCPDCGARMWRKPQRINVNWRGLKPSQGNLAPALQRHLSSAPELRDRLAEKKEAHERRTSNARARRQYGDPA